MKLGDRYWRAFPVAVRAASLMVIACILFSITGGLIKLLGQRLDSRQIGFFKASSGGAAIIVGSTPHITYQEAPLSRLQRATLAAKPVAQRPGDVVREAAVELSTEPLRLRV